MTPRRWIPLLAVAVLLWPPLSFAGNRPAANTLAGTADVGPVPGAATAPAGGASDFSRIMSEAEHPDAAVPPEASAGPETPAPSASPETAGGESADAGFKAKPETPHLYGP